MLPEWESTSDTLRRKPEHVGPMATRRQSGDGSIYRVRTGFRTYVWVTTSAGRKQRKYVCGKTREEAREVPVTSAET
jgi:hypothetical protein